ncbi:MAG: hypothetical protein R3C68_14550 [Myxococcota bacterium]
MSEAKIIRLAALFTVSGLVIESLCLLSITPTTFMIFLLLGLPLTVGGAFIYLRYVWRLLISREAL